MTAHQVGEWIDEPTQKLLLAVARDGLEAAVRGRERAEIPGEHGGLLAEPGACFVTLHAQGQLRGCIGSLEPSAALSEMARAMACAAAQRDPRFPPVRELELPLVRLSVSVLGPPRPLRSMADVVIGRDGLIVRRGSHHGVLLPQVAEEAGWDVEAFLAHTCHKAGLPPSAYRDPETEVLVFSAQVVAEPE